MKWSGMKTIICDIDGTLLDYQHDIIPHAGHTRDHTALPGVVKRMRQWEVEGCRIVIITGRRESERVRTEKDLRYHNIPYDMLIMDLLILDESLSMMLVERVSAKLMLYHFQEIKGLKNLIGKKWVCEN